MDIFDIKGIEPMLIREQVEPFSDSRWLYELKLDGLRCIAYFDGVSVDLRNKRSMVLLPRFPELCNISERVKAKCILDGELLILSRQGKPDFSELQRRTVLSDRFKIQQSMMSFPASYVAYDILYYKDKEIIELPLIERKKLLSDTVSENSSLAISRYVFERGIDLYQLAEQQELEGVVAKRSDSRYYYGKRSNDWKKFKRVAEENLVVVGFVRKRPMNVLILGKYENGNLVYRGSVSFGVNLRFMDEYNCRIVTCSPFTGKEGNSTGGESGIQWIEPLLVCRVSYMPNIKDSLRQPVFKGIRNDISVDDLKLK